MEANGNVSTQSQSPVADGEITTECLGPQFGVTSTSHQSPGTGYSDFSVPTRQKLLQLKAEGCSTFIFILCIDFMCVSTFLCCFENANSVKGIDEIDSMEVTGTLDSPMSHCLKLIGDAHGTKPVNIVAASDKGWCQGRAPQNNARWLSVAAILCPQQRAVEMSRNLNINDGG